MTSKAAVHIPLKVGYDPADKLSVIGDTRPEWLYSELAIQALGGAVVGIYPDSHLEQVAYIINHSDATYVVAGDQEQADKVLDLKSTLRNVRKVIVDDPKGMRHYDHPVLAYFREVQKLGRELAEQQPGLFAEMIAQVSADDIGMTNYTSGTTGLPKGSMITQKNMVRVAEIQNQVDAACERFPWVSRILLREAACVNPRLTRRPGLPTLPPTTGEPGRAPG